MTSILLFIAGALVAAVVLMLANQKKTRQLEAQVAALSSDVAAKQREAEMLSGRLAEAKAEGERRLAEAKRQHDLLLAEANRRNENDKAELRAMLDKQFADRLKLVQEQLNTTTERLLKQRSEELDKPTRPR